MMMQPIASTGRSPASLELVGINKRFGGRWAARGLNLAVKPGKLLVLLGPSGSGKSTTLNMIAGFLAPDAGQVVVDGKDLAKVPTHRRNFGMVFQESTLFPHLSVAENIGYGLKLRKVPAQARKRKLAEILALIDMEGRESSYPTQLSGGEQQRVGLARALVLEPLLLLLDEPLSSLDAKLRRQIRDEIRTIQMREGITTVMVTHDQEEALAIGDVVAVIDQGVLQQADTPENLYRKPANVFVAGFIGETNLLPGTVDGREPSGDIVRTDGGLTVIGVGPARPVANGDRVVVLIRPENVTTRPLVDGAQPQSMGANTALGTVRVTQFLGSRKRCVIDLDGGSLPMDVDAAPYEAVQPGRRVQVAWRAEDTVIVRE